jgi:hypothetical protein
VVESAKSVFDANRMILHIWPEGQRPEETN